MARRLHVSSSRSTAAVLARRIRALGGGSGSTRRRVGAPSETAFRDRDDLQRQFGYFGLGGTVRVGRYRVISDGNGGNGHRKTLLGRPGSPRAAEPSGPSHSLSAPGTLGARGFGDTDADSYRDSSEDRRHPIQSRSAEGEAVRRFTSDVFSVYQGGLPVQVIVPDGRDGPTARPGPGSPVRPCGYGQIIPAIREVVPDGGQQDDDPPASASPAAAGRQSHHRGRGLRSAAAVPDRIPRRVGLRQPGR